MRKTRDFLTPPCLPIEPIGGLKQEAQEGLASVFSERFVVSQFPPRANESLPARQEKIPVSGIVSQFLQ